MANSKQLKILKQGAKAWNIFRKQNPGVIADFDQADLNKAILRRANLYGGQFRQASLQGANLSEADLRRADLRGANLYAADLRRTDLRETKLNGANLHRAIFEDTILADTDLRDAQGLDTCQHTRASILDHRTLAQSGRLPLPFLRGCGLPDKLIDYLPSLLNDAIHFYSCFISYLTEDKEFATRLHADLQDRGVRCWFAPHDLQGGKKLYEQVDQAIQVHDRLLLILSTASINSEWVRTEIAKARKREAEENRRMLFPLRLMPFETLRHWECFDSDRGKDSAREIREYFVPDFSNWKNHDSYQEAFQRLVADLRDTNNITSFML